MMTLPRIRDSTALRRKNHARANRPLMILGLRLGVFFFIRLFNGFVPPDGDCASGIFGGEFCYSGGDTFKFQNGVFCDVAQDGVCHFMHDDSEPIVGHGSRIEVDGSLVVPDQTFENFFIRGSHDFYLPPTAVEFETHAGHGFLTAFGRRLAHVSSGGYPERVRDQPKKPRPEQAESYKQG